MSDFQDTSLHDITKLGGMGPVGAGSLGGTIWSTQTPQAQQWVNTYLNDIAKLGGMGPVGSGSLGGTIWEKTQ